MEQNDEQKNQQVYTSLATSYYQQVFENRENEFVHNPYNHELRESAAIERGDEEELRMILTENFAGRYGNLSDDPLRNEINMGIVTITLASRAAIRGGMRYEEAFTLSDICIQQMEKCSDPQTVKQVYREAEYQYAHLVHEIKIKERKEAGENFAGKLPEVPNRHIEHCKDYIFTHLHGKLTVREIADSIGLEPNYLSALFHKCEKITLKQYIMREKINLVQKTLMYSPNTFTEIATYFGFSSQSHMGAEFKKITGMTPRQYRELYQKEDFLGKDAG